MRPFSIERRAGWRRVKLCDIVSDTDESQSCALRQPASRKKRRAALCVSPPLDLLDGEILRCAQNDTAENFSE
jgi:hypothetical protein